MPGDHGVFHRDLKPGNILVGEDGEPYLLDFGLAKITYSDGEGSDPGLTLPESVLGTPAYMSPEQATGFRNVRLLDDPALAGCDIYSMGALLYELLTGQPAFSGVSPQEILSKVQTENPPRLRSINLLFELRLFHRGKAGDQILARDPSSYCDFTLVSPLDYLLARERQPGVRLLASLPDNESKGFVFFVRQDSSITNCAGLKGKIVDLGDPSSPATTFA